MLDSVYKNYLVDNCKDDESVNIKQVIVRLYKEGNIDLITAKRLRYIYDTLVKFPDTESFKLTEKLNYNSNDEIEKIKLEIVFLLEKLMVKNIETNTEELNIKKYKEYLSLARTNKLNASDIELIKQEILFTELDNGYDFKFLVYANEYLKDNIKKYFIKK